MKLELNESSMMKDKDQLLSDSKFKFIQRQNEKEQNRLKKQMSKLQKCRKENC